MTLLAAGLSGSVQGYPALPNVEAELDAVQETFGGRRLLDESFIEQSVERELNARTFSVVHLATHGVFGRGDQDSFVLTWDSRITMERLGDLVRLSRYRDRPIELLTLSACETAAGEERAALGLAGIAIRAGARSALATLWPVHDQAAATLVARFYRELADPSVSRARALQRAQLHLLEQRIFRHPGYWSPFLLISSWR